jgi:ribose/xylose/arabinose/galactoside ABC-type transport system permease subunit
VGTFLARGFAFLVSLNAIPIKHPVVNAIIDFGIPLACVGLELEVIAAVVIGGTLLTGGGRSTSKGRWWGC